MTNTSDAFHPASIDDGFRITEVLLLPCDLDARRRGFVARVVVYSRAGHELRYDLRAPTVDRQRATIVPRGGKAGEGDRVPAVAFIHHEEIEDVAGLAYSCERAHRAGCRAPHDRAGTHVCHPFSFYPGPPDGLGLDTPIRN